MADTQDTAVVDLEKGILQLAQLNNTIQAKHKTITDLEEKEKVLQSDIHALEKNKK
jgi:cell division protein FtsB